MKNNNQLVNFPRKSVNFSRKLVRFSRKSVILQTLITIQTQMKTTDQIDKIKAVVLYILEKLDTGVDYIHLFKMMYFAQQNHLVLYGIPLMEDTFKARKHGPVPSVTYKVMRYVEGKSADVRQDLADFCSAIEVRVENGHQMIYRKENRTCDLEELSVSNIRILDFWIEKLRDIKSFELFDLSHDAAWEKAMMEADRTGEDIAMTLVDIAAAGGASKAMQNVIRERQLNARLFA